MKTTNRFSCILILSFFLMWSAVINAQETAAATFSWPTGKLAAISISFDDARTSQIDSGLALLDKYGVKATFFVLPSSVEQRLDGWRKAVASGHEIGNHSLNHPCTGNFPWSKPNALEDYSLEKMSSQLVEANNRIHQLLGVKPDLFAYPCGQTFVGRGLNTKSYVPLIAQLFLSGRGWLDEGPNDPAFCDFAHVTGMETDGKNFDQILSVINNAKNSGMWLVLAGHEMGELGLQTTSLVMLKKLIEYAQDKSNGIWIAPIGTVARYIQVQRKKGK